MKETQTLGWILFIFHGKKKGDKDPSKTVYLIMTHGIKFQIQRSNRKSAESNA